MLTTSTSTKSGHRIWSYAAAAAVVMVLGPTFAASISWFTGTGRDPDMTGVHELIFFLLMISALPAVALAFGILALAALALLIRPLSVWSVQPERALIPIIAFALPGAIAALGMRHRAENGDRPVRPLFSHSR